MMILNDHGTDSQSDRNENCSSDECDSDHSRIFFIVSCLLLIVTCFVILYFSHRKDRAYFASQQTFHLQFDHDIATRLSNRDNPRHLLPNLSPRCRKKLKKSQQASCRASECFILRSKHPVARQSATSAAASILTRVRVFHPVAASTLSRVRVLNHVAASILSRVRVLNPVAISILSRVRVLHHAAVSILSRVRVLHHVAASTLSRVRMLHLP